MVSSCVPASLIRADELFPPVHPSQSSPLASSTRLCVSSFPPLELKAHSFCVQLWDSMDPAQKEGMLEAQRKRLPVGFVAKAEDVVEAYLYLVKCQLIRTFFLPLEELIVFAPSFSRPRLGPYVTGETIKCGIHLLVLLL